MSNWKLGKIQYGFLETATSAGTLVLVFGSKQYQVLTGTQNHTVQLPDATTMGAGESFVIVNVSTGIITVNNNGAVLQASVAAGTTSEFIVTDVSTANGVWRTYSSGSSSLGGIGSQGPSSTAKTTNYTIVSGDTGGEINVDTRSSAISITLPSPANNFKVTIKDAFGNAAANPITVLRSSSTITIDLEVNDDIINQNFEAISYISDGTNWFRASSFFSQGTSGPNNSSAPTGLFGGGNTGSASSVIDYVTIATTSNAVSFGSLSVARDGSGGCASATRGLFGGGENNSAINQNIIDYVVFSTVANATTFGNLTLARQGAAAVSSDTRGIWAGGFDGTNRDNNIDYVTIATTGNATSFGTLSSVNQYLAGCGSPTRGVFGGGDTGSTSNVINYITIATTGNSTSFGTLTTARKVLGSCSNSTIGTWGGGNTGSDSAVIDYVTIATTGNATSFGNLTAARRNLAVGSCSSPIRGLFAAGATGPSAVIDYITFSSIGNATSFGNLTVARYSPGSCSNAHGGL
jgi:hypothetical protein